MVKKLNISFPERYYLKILLLNSNSIYNRSDSNLTKNLGEM